MLTEEVELVEISFRDWKMEDEGEDEKSGKGLVARSASYSFLAADKGAVLCLQKQVEKHEELSRECRFGSRSPLQTRT